MITEKLLEIFISGIVTSPMIGLFAYLWWSERDERRNLQEKYEALVSRTEKGLSDGTTAIESSVTSQQAMHNLMETLKILLISRGRFQIDDVDSHRDGR